MAAARTPAALEVEPGEQPATSQQTLTSRLSRVPRPSPRACSLGLVAVLFGSAVVLVILLRRQQLRQDDRGDRWRYKVPDPSVQGVEAVRVWAAKRIQQAEDSFRKEPFERWPSPDNWASAVVYNILVDRFNNGDTSNDELNLASWERDARVKGDYSRLHAMRHGGDLQGIRDRLGYLADLGVSVLWITPVFAHDGTYHGYCTTDPLHVDQGFGTSEDLRLLVAEAHFLGLRVVLDIVGNHLCNPETTYEPARHAEDPKVQRCADALYDRYLKDAQPPGQGEDESDAQAKLVFSDGFFRPFRSMEFFNRCGPMLQEQLDGAGPVTFFGDVAAGKFDYNTRNKDWQEIFTNLHKYWIAYADVDGFRLDAAKYVTEDFVAYFSTETRAYAETLGKHNFLVSGEVVGKHTIASKLVGAMRCDPAKTETEAPLTVINRLRDLQKTYQAHNTFPKPGLNSVCNFAESGQGKSTLLGTSSPKDLRYYFNGQNPEMSLVMQQLDPACGKKNSDACTVAMMQLWTCLERHDWPRFLGQRPDNQSFGVLGLVWLFTAPGQPILYYGQEQGFTGICPGDERIHVEGPTKELCASASSGEAALLSQQDFFSSGPWRLGSAVPSVDGQAFVGQPQAAESPPWREDPMLPRGHLLYRTARGLADLRSSCPALVEGPMVWRHAQDAYGGLMIYSRLLRGEHPMEVVVVINPQDTVVKQNKIFLDPEINTESGLNYTNALDTSKVGKTKVVRGKMRLVFDGDEGRWPRGAWVFVRTDWLQLPAVEGMAVCNPPSIRPSAGTRVAV